MSEDVPEAVKLVPITAAESVASTKPDEGLTGHRYKSIGKQFFPSPAPLPWEFDFDAIKAHLQALGVYELRGRLAEARELMESTSEGPILGDTTAVIARTVAALRVILK